MNLLKLTRYRSGPESAGGPVFLNPEFIAMFERDVTDHYTRLEMAGGTIVKVAETPDVIVEESRYAALTGVA